MQLRPLYDMQTGPGGASPVPNVVRQRADAAAATLWAMLPAQRVRRAAAAAHADQSADRAMPPPPAALPCRLRAPDRSPIGRSCCPGIGAATARCRCRRRSRHRVEADDPAASVVASAPDGDDDEDDDRSEGDRARSEETEQEDDDDNADDLGETGERRPDDERREQADLRPRPAIAPTLQAADRVSPSAAASGSSPDLVDAHARPTQTARRR